VEQSLTSSVEQTVAPFEIIEALVHEWFELFYSVCPMLHRATFLKRLTPSELENDRGYSALVTAICAATLANLRQRGRTVNDQNTFGGLTVESCLSFIEGLGFFNSRQATTLERCQTLYNVAIATQSVQGMDAEEPFQFFGATVIGLKWLIYYKLPTMPMMSQQLLKRLFWLMFAGQWYVLTHGC